MHKTRVQLVIDYFKDKHTSETLTQVKTDEYLVSKQYYPLGNKSLVDLFFYKLPECYNLLALQMQFF